MNILDFASVFIFGFEKKIRFNNEFSVTLNKAMEIFTL